MYVRHESVSFFVWEGHVRPVMTVVSPPAKLAWKHLSTSITFIFIFTAGCCCSLWIYITFLKAELGYFIICISSTFDSWNHSCINFRHKDRFLRKGQILLFAINSAQNVLSVCSHGENVFAHFTFRASCCWHCTRDRDLVLHVGCTKDKQMLGSLARRCCNL